MKAHEGFAKMDAWGKEKRPFFFLIDYEINRVEVYDLDGMEDILFDINGVRNHQFSYSNIPIPITAKRIPFMEYKRAYDIVFKELHYGNSFLLNLTRANEIQIEHDLKTIFLNSRAKYKLLYKNEFVVFSPEPFIKISDQQISSYPMKGTANANIPNAAQKLLDNEKELSEHYTIVDLIRNDLSIVSDNVRVESFRYIEKIQSRDKELFQLSSKIVGDLSSDWHSEIGSILSKLLPAGSISGAPKKKTLEIIRSAEQGSRGFYTGIMGMYDGESLDSGVMIRFIEKQGDKYYYKSGGGITFQSDLNKEYSELIDKIYVPIYRND